MPYQSGQSGNPAGRPPGAKERIGIPIRVQKELIKALTERAIKHHDHAAQETLALWLICQDTEAAHAVDA